MFCVYCQKELFECTCPDLEERLRSLSEHPNWHIAKCKKCGKPLSICDCEIVKEDIN